LIIVPVFNKSSTEPSCTVGIAAVLEKEIDVGDTLQEDSSNLKYPDVGS
jgi:hypothetical protein